MTGTQAGQPKTLPDPHADFVFTVSGGGWALALLLIAVSLLAVAVIWRHQRRRR